MMRALSVAVRMCFLAVFCSLAPSLVLADPVETSVWIEISREAGVVFNGEPLPKEGEGAGVAIASREVVTAAHVVWGAEKISVVLANGLVVPARITDIDRDLDIAILRVERPLTIFSAARMKPVVTGERVSAVERPRPNEAPRVTSANIGATRWPSNGVLVPLIFSGIKGEKGMSGGGLFDSNGELVGIIIRIDGELSYLNALQVVELCTRFSRCSSAR